MQSHAVAYGLPGMAVFKCELLPCFLATKKHVMQKALLAVRDVAVYLWYLLERPGNASCCVAPVVL